MTAGTRLVLSLISMLFAAAVIGAAALGLWAVAEVRSSGPLQQEKIVLIARGSGLSSISGTLEQEGVIRYGVLFNIYARISGQHASLKAGEYQFAPHITMAEIMTMMKEGRVYDRKITVPEGYTSYQIVNILNGVAALEGPAIEIVPAEGALLPETYHYIAGDKREDVLNKMQEAMKGTLEAAWATRHSDLPYSTPQEAMVLASIIEKETGVAGERKKIAGVFINRLRKGIALQSDPTVIYALTNGKIEEDGQGPLGRRLLRTDLEYVSPYNTYKNTGLPPGPIANPGRAAIEAALQPEKHDLIYFVADGTGGHVFAATLEEHNKNVAQWRVIRKSR